MNLLFQPNKKSIFTISFLVGSFLVFSKIASTGLSIPGNDYINILILPFCAGIIIFFLFKGASFKVLSFCCLASIFIEHFIFSVRLIILMYSEMPVSEMILKSFSILLWVGLPEVCLATFGCYLMSKLKNSTKFKHIKEKNV